MSWLVNSGRYKLTRGARLTPLSLPRPSHSAAAAGAAMSTCNSAKGATAAAGLPGLPARRLLEAGVALVKGFDPLIQTVDAYAEEALRKKFQAGSGLSQDDAVFLREILFGCVRRKEALKVFLTRFYADMAARVLRSEYTSYLLLSYLLLYRIRDMGFSRFQWLVSGLDPTKVCQLLQYMTDWEQVGGRITQDLMTIYDVSYIRLELFGGLREIEDEITAYCARLQFRAFGMAQAQEEAASRCGVTKVAGRRATSPKPFRLTQPRPRKLPEPMRIDTGVNIGPAPTYMGRTSMQEIEEVGEMRRRKMLEATRRKYAEADLRGDREFKLSETRTNLESERRRAESELVAELTFAPSLPPPPAKRPPPDVRVNASAILREDALLKKKQAQDAALIKAYEEELRDNTEFYRWQGEMKKKDELDKLAHVDQVRQDAIQSSASAKLAREMQEMSNAEVAHSMKCESAAMAKRRNADEQMQLQAKREIVKTVAQSRQAPQKAVKRVLSTRRVVVDAVKADLEAAFERKAAADEAEALHRRNFVLKLKEQDVHQRTVQVFDPTESAGLGLLTEMSLAETKERLAMNKREEMKREENRRQLIQEEKRHREADLRRRQEAVAKVKSAAKRAARADHQQHALTETLERIKEAEKREGSGSRLLEELRKRREVLRARRLALAKEEEARRKEAQYLGTAAAAVEETAFTQLLLGQEREALRRRACMAIEDQKMGVIQARERQQLASQVRRQTAERKRMYKAQDEKLLRAREQAAQSSKLEMRAKQQRVSVARSKEQALRDATATRRPYNISAYPIASSKGAARNSSKIPIS